jgi:hypothetical protein
VLFALVMKGRPGTLKESSVHRLQWQPPDGVNIVGEYWFPTDDPSVVAIVEAENTAPMAGIRLAWDDLADITVFPIITAEEGLERIRQIMPGQG